MTERTRRRIALTLALGAGFVTGLQAQTAVATAGASPPAIQRYRLIEVGGSALPVEVEKEWRCRESVTRASLTLGTDSVWTLRSTLHEVCGDRTEVETEVEHGRYTRDGATLRFYDDDGEDDWDWELGRDLDLEDLDGGTLAQDGTLTVHLQDGETALVFRQ